MKIAMPNRLIACDGYYYKPYNRYVVSDWEMGVLIENSPNTNWHWSSFNSWERRYGGQDLNGKKICIYRHNAWGDQLIVSALPRYLKMLWPDAHVHLYCHPDVMPLWIGDPNVEMSAISLPIPFDAVSHAYDYHAFFEGMLEGNSERGQNNCYDDLFAWCGLKDVPAEYKRPSVIVHPNDWKVFSGLGFKPATKYVLYHVRPNNLNRMYPLGQGLEAMRLLQAKLGVMVVFVGHKLRATDYTMLSAFMYKHQPRAGKPPPFINLVDKTPGFRDLFPFVKHARLVVCPDSSILHLAAGLDTPTVSMWGLFHPDDRAKYYPKNTAIFRKNACPFAPCHDHNFELPEHQCKESGLWKDAKMTTGFGYCGALASITPLELAETAMLVWDKHRGEQP